MHLDALVWIFLPVMVAAGSALLAFYVVQAQLEVAVAKERESLAEAHAVIKNQQLLMEEKVRAAEESTRRKAFDDFLQDFRTEERHYFRESSSLFMKRKSMILQERLFFRNIPLSNWVEHEMPVEEGLDIQHLAKACSVFSPKALGNGTGASPKMAKLLTAR